MNLRLLGPADGSATSAPSSSLIARALAMSSPRRAVSQPEAAASVGVWSPPSEGLGVAVSSSGWVLDGERAGVASGWGAPEVLVSLAFAEAALEALEALTLAVAFARAHAVAFARAHAFLHAWHGELQQAQCVSQFSGEDRVPPNGHTQSVRLAPPVPQTKTPETLCATRYDDPRFVWTSLTTTH